MGPYMGPWTRQVQVDIYTYKIDTCRDTSYRTPAKPEAREEDQLRCRAASCLKSTDTDRVAPTSCPSVRSSTGQSILLAQSGRWSWAAQLNLDPCVFVASPRPKLVFRLFQSARDTWPSQLLF